MQRASAIWWAAFCGLRAVSVYADCYAHDGVLARNSKFYSGPELVPCGNSTNNCCLEGEKCGSNLLCSDADGNVARQYCADRNWKECSTTCSDYAGAGVILFDCGVNVFCCGDVSNDCCKDPRNSFFVDPETGEVKDPSKFSATQSPTWWKVDSKALLATADSKTSTTSDLSVDAPPPLTTSATVSSRLPTTIPPPLMPTSESTDSNYPLSNGKKDLSVSKIIGIGIGAAAGLIIFVVLAWWLFKRKQNKTVTPTHELGTNLKGPEYYAHVAEAPDNTQVREVEGTSVRWELHAESSTPRPE